MNRLLAVFLTALALLPNDGAAQDALRRGDRVRVRSTSGTVLIGVLDSVAPTGVVLQAESMRRLVAIPQFDIAELEQSLGQHRQFGNTFGTAVGIGAGVGGLLFAITWTPSDSNWIGPNSRGEALWWGMAAGAVTGGLVGLIAGLGTTERWRTVSLPTTAPLRLSVAPMFGDRFGLAGSIALWHTR